MLELGARKIGRKKKSWASYQIFKKVGLNRISIFRGELLEKRGGCSFYIKNKLKSEIFDDKKNL